MFFRHLPLFMSPLRGGILIVAFATLGKAFGQAKKPGPARNVTSGQRAIKLAKTGHCEEAVPALKRAFQRIADKAVKRTAAFAGVRCAMLLNQMDAAVDFLRLLSHEFPDDPEVLSLSVHTFSDL